jgi:hypothetical protein
MESSTDPCPAGDWTNTGEFEIMILGGELEAGNPACNFVEKSVSMTGFDQKFGGYEDFDRGSRFRSPAGGRI